MALVQTASAWLPAFAEVARAPGEPPESSWAHPERGLQAAAFGIADVREGESLRSVLALLDVPEGFPHHMPGPWFGAAAFSGRLGPDWSGFAPIRFTLPRLLAWTDGGRHFVATFGEGAERRLTEARRRLDVPARAESPPRAPSHARVRGGRGERARWDALVTSALREIAAGTLDKVVLARAIDVEAAKPIDPGAVLRALEAQYRSCRTFLIRGGDAAFVGATRVSVNRALADLESQGAIAVGRRHISVKEPALLRKQARY